MRRKHGLVAALLLSVACDKQPEKTALKPAVAPVVQPVVVAAPGLPESELRALLGRWVDTQNQGAFEGYAQLYAERFLGIKRAGERVTNFTHESWLADRKRMFAKPMKVEANDVLVRAGAESAEVSFTQRWASGTFEDVGPKRMVIVRENGALTIAQEEMLRSNLVRAHAAAAFDFHFTLPLQSGLYMPLPELTAPAKHGPVRAEHQAGDAASTIYASSAPIADADLPASVAAWKGAKLRLEGGCVAEVRGFVLLTRVEPHFGTVQEWNGEEEGAGQPPRKLNELETAQAAFALTAPTVAALLQGCASGSYAQREATPAPVQAEEVSDAALLQKARAAFAKLPSVLELQKRHRVEAEDPSGLWWEPSVSVRAFRHPGSGQTLVSVHADNGGVCEEFAASEWAIFEQQGAKLVRLYNGEPPAEVVRALDVNADGRLELIVTSQSLSSDIALVSPDAQGPSTQLEHSYQDCPC